MNTFLFIVSITLIGIFGYSPDDRGYQQKAGAAYEQAADDIVYYVHLGMRLRRNDSIIAANARTIERLTNNAKH